MADEDTSLKNQSPELGENQEVLMDSEDLFDEQGNLNTQAVAPVSSGGSKVELDLDDAPFLKEEEKESKPEEAAKPNEGELAMPASEEAAPESFIKKLFKRKKLLIGAGAGLVLLIAGIVVLLLLGGEEPPKEAATETHTAEQTEPPSPVEVLPGEVLIHWEPFWVEYTGQDGETRFLICELSSPTTDPALKAEADSKTLAIRDAIYYYLAHKPLTFLSEQNNADVLKEDLLGVINGYLTRGQLSKLYIENYLIR